jgi:phosphoribosylanthranilate isomerase
MLLKYCAFTGPDDAVSPKDLLALSAEFPFAEWSILYVPNRGGEPRMPTENWIRDFKAACKGKANICLHLCADALPGLVAGDKKVLEIMDGFPRIQMNFEYLDAGALIEADALTARVRAMPNFEFIVQYGKKFGDKFLPGFRGIPNHAVLFDGSAGEGIAPGEWSPPIEGHPCGYAGGLNPTNFQKHMAAIDRAVPRDYVTWVDQETGARTDNKFDLNKVRMQLEMAAPYAARPSAPRSQPAPGK